MGLYSQNGRLIIHNGSFITEQVGAPTPPPATDLADIHYFFNNNGDDDSGNGYNASTSGMVYSTSSPAEGTHCADFGGTSRLFTVPSSYTWSSPFSISLWFRTTLSSGFPEFLSPFKENGDWEYWRFWLRADFQNVEFRGYQNGTNSLDLAQSSSSVWDNDNSWHHLAFIYVNGTCAFYIDGSDVTSNSTTWNTSNMKLDYTTMNIGKWFNGDIDDFSVYSLELSSTQVTTLYNSGTAGTVLTE